MPLDFKGQSLCRSCWNGQHFTFKTNQHGKRTHEKISNCEHRLDDGSLCECECRNLLAEQERRRKAAREVA